MDTGYKVVLECFGNIPSLIALFKCSLVPSLQSANKLSLLFVLVTQGFIMTLQYLIADKLKKYTSIKFCMKLGKFTKNHKMLYQAFRKYS